MGACAATLTRVESRIEASARASAASAWAWPVFCCALTLAAILIAQPFNPSGFADDWSYARTALRLSQTGRIEYNGWGGSLMLFQALWAVPWIRAFGFSFPVLQAATIPISLGFVLLIYASGLRLGLARQFAAFAAAGVGTSALFVPLAASYMTEPYACLFGMACVYCALRALQAVAWQEAVRWLWLLALAGLAGGATRQIVWAAPLSLIPLTAFERRREKGFLTHAGLAFGVLGAGIGLVLHFFYLPYAALETGPLLRWLLIHRSLKAALSLGDFLLLCILLALPAFACFAARLPWRPVFRFAILLGGLTVLTLAEIIAGWPAAPFGNSMVTASGVAFAESGIVLPAQLRVALTLLTGVSAAACVVFLMRSCGRLLRHPYRTPFLVFSIFSASYVALLVPGALAGYTYDRYILPLLPLMLLAIAKAACARMRSVPWYAWFCLILFGAYSTAATHDCAASIRARAEAAQRLEQRGISRSNISAGFEYDGWTHLQSSRRALAPRFEDQYVDYSDKGCWIEIWNHLPGFNPDYVVVSRRGSDSLQGALDTGEFHAWLPPFRRQVAVRKRSELTLELEAARMISEIPLLR